jgi:two-component system, NtrC family, sensor histidine kinase KinB
LLLVFLVMAWSAYSILKLGRSSESILRENYQSIMAAEHMIDAIERQDSSMLLMLLGFQEPWRNEFLAQQAVFWQWLGRAKDNITVAGEEGIVKAIQAEYSQYVIEAANLLIIEKENHSRGVTYYHKSVFPLFRAVTEGCIKLRELNHETMYQASRRTHRLAGRVMVSVIIFGWAAILVGLAFSLVLSRFLSRPATLMTKALAELAEGRYDVRVPVQGKDELANLAGQLNVMAQELKKYHELNIEKILAEKSKIEALIQSVDEGIVMVDGNLLVTGMNPMAADIFQVDKDESTGKHVLEIIHNEKLTELLKKTLDTGSSPELMGEQNIYLRQNGKITNYYQYSIMPIKGPSMLQAGVVLLLRDITRLQELDRLKSDFILRASHELRTPLTSLGLSIRMIEEAEAEKLGERGRELLNASQEDVERLKTMVEELLNLSRIEAGKLDLNFQPIRPEFICEKATNRIQSQAESKKITLSLSAEAELPNVKADLEKIDWVMVNLLTNALKFTPMGGNIWVKVFGDGQFVQFSITDDGEGVPYEYQSRVFEKFFQVPTPGKPSGLGLGLAICKEIVNAHGGAIWLESIPGEGSTFNFNLPIMI